MAILARKNHAIMYLGTGLINFIWVILSGGVIRNCENVDQVFGGIAYGSPIKWALDGLLITTIDKYNYINAFNNNIIISGKSILINDYCFSDFRHANVVSLCFIALGGYLGALLIIFFIAGRIVQLGRD